MLSGRRIVACSLGVALAVLVGALAQSDAGSLVALPRARAETKAQTHWCAPELQPLSDTVCVYSPSTKPIRGERTLVIFLHSLVGAEPGAAWPQQQRMVRNADAYGFTALVPRGRPALGPTRDPNVLAWPTALELQEQHEEQLLAQWKKALTKLERKSGHFDRVLLFGFSNGAYYATSIAFRERFDVDGVAVFAGGSGSKYQRLMAGRASHRTPMFVGYGTQDPDHPRQRALVKLLRDLHWPHRSLAASVGHTVSDAQIRAALAFLGHHPEAAAP